MNIYLLWFLTSILSSTVHRTAGFGFGIVTLAIMQFFSTDIPETAALVSIIALAIPMVTLLTVGIRKVNLKVALPCILGYMLTQPLANRLVLDMDTKLIKATLGALFVVIAVLSFIPNDKKRIAPHAYVGLGIGCISGVLGGLFSISGPPVAIFCLSSSKDRDEYMATISAFFAVTAIYSTVVRILYGILSSESLPKAGAGLLGMVIGLYLGSRLLSRIKGDNFRKVVNAVIGITGLWYLVSSVFNL